MMPSLGAGYTCATCWVVSRLGVLIFALYILDVASAVDRLLRQIYGISRWNRRADISGPADDGGTEMADRRLSARLVCDAHGCTHRTDDPE